MADTDETVDSTDVTTRPIIFPTPLEAACTLRHDAGWTATGEPTTDANGRPGQMFAVPDPTPNGHGAELSITADGMIPINLRGALQIIDGAWKLFVDDFRLQPVPTPPPDPPDPPPSGAQTPKQIIDAVWATGKHELVTKSGCGHFTEACCTALHDQHSKYWGHIRKEPGQNQYNGHAVDAIALLLKVSNSAGTTEQGFYDIITSSESPEARPAFNHAEGFDPSLWYYPA